MQRVGREKSDKFVIGREKTHRYRGMLDFISNSGLAAKKHIRNTKKLTQYNS